MFMRHLRYSFICSPVLNTLTRKLRYFPRQISRNPPADPYRCFCSLAVPRRGGFPRLTLPSNRLQAWDVTAGFPKASPLHKCLNYAKLRCPDGHKATSTAVYLSRIFNVFSMSSSRAIKIFLCISQNPRAVQRTILNGFLYLFILFLLHTWPVFQSSLAPKWLSIKMREKQAACELALSLAQWDFQRWSAYWR